MELIHYGCVLLIVLATQRDSASASANSIPGADHGQDECCACGHAMYEVEFQGMWSRQTHPKGFPDEKNSFQLHWSNIVGATHGSDYRIWDYGQMASKAVKEVCEYGSSRSLENEMRENSEKIRTVIKTKQLWGPEKILESVKAVYTVNKKKHLLSLLTMIGPSPDWCLGVSSNSMCMANCTWRDSLEIDLYPWDAGTDSRVTYMGRKQPTVPAERIHRITSTFPSDRRSPFYGQDIRPLARLTIKKKKEACTDDDGRSASAEVSPSTDELVSQMKKKMMMKKKLEMEKCATSQWSDWSDCNNPCGTGMRERRRMLKNQGITAAMCGIDLLETETCVGGCTDSQRNKLSDNFVMRHEFERDPDDKCAVTGWSDWSPCSATCGLGMKERWRMFLRNTEKSVDCGVHLMEKDLCRGNISDCRTAMLMKNFTAICSEPASVGPCGGDFPRWFYNSTMQKCQVFHYSGCRGNENRFETEKECVDLCAEHMATVARGGVSHLTRKQQMMRKEMEMEQQVLIEKQRMMEKQLMMEKQKTMEEDMRRKQLLMEKQRMMEKQGQTMSDEERKAFMMKQKMMQAQQGAQEPMMKKHMDVQRHGIPPPMDKQKAMMLAKQQQMEEEKAKMMRKQKKMLKKKARQERRRRKRRRMRKQRMMEEANGGKRLSHNDKQSDGPRIDCMVTPWSSWSQCSVTCGKGLVMKTRMIKAQPKNGGKRCPRRLVKKKKCRQRKCPINCSLDVWGDWGPCSKTCGDNSVQIRRRAVLQRPKHGGQACAARREKRFCNVPMCPDSRTR